MIRQLISELRNNNKLILLFVIVTTGMLAIQIVPFMFVHDIYPDYYETILPRAFVCDTDSRNPLKYFVHCMSFQITGYPNALIMPFTIGLVPLTYLLGYYLTKDRLIGLLAMIGLTANPLYSNWTNTGTYDQMFTFFLLLSVVLIFKGRGTKTSFVSWIVAGLSKSMAIMYFPMWFYSVWKIRKDYDMLVISGLLIALFVTILIYTGEAPKMIGSNITFHPEDIGDAILGNLTVFLDIIPILALFAGINCFFVPKNKVINKRLVVYWMLFVFATVPIIHLFTDQQTYTYRYTILGSFMSVFIAIVLVEIGNFIVETNLKARTH
jgi:hypothetical protein